jgi:hypothetical protein
MIKKKILIVVVFGLMVMNKSFCKTVFNRTNDDYDTIRLTKSNILNISFGELKSKSVLIGDTVDYSIRLRQSVTINADSIVLMGLLWDSVEGVNLEIKGCNIQVLKCRFTGFGKKHPSKAIWIREDGTNDNNLVSGCEFTNWGSTGFHSSCIKVGQVGANRALQGTILKNNKITNGPENKRGNNVAIQVFSPTIIRDNAITGCEDAIELKGNDNKVLFNKISQCTGDEIISNRFGSRNWVEGNVISHINSIPITIWSGQNNTFINNIVYSSARAVHIKGGEALNERARYCLVANNLFINNDRGITWDLKSYPPDHITIINNTFINNKATIDQVAFDKLDISISNNRFSDVPAVGSNSSILKVNAYIEGKTITEYLDGNHINIEQLIKKLW